MMNKVTLFGRIGSKEMKSTKDGKEICLLSLATNRKYKNASGEKITDTTWHNVNFFDKLADLASKYLEVGDLALVEGRINSKTVETDNGKRTYYSIVAENLTFVPKQSSGKSDEKNKSNDSDDELDDDVPF